MGIILILSETARVHTISDEVASLATLNALVPRKCRSHYRSTFSAEPIKIRVNELEDLCSCRR